MNRTLPILLKSRGVYRNDAIGSQSKYTTENLTSPALAPSLPPRKSEKVKGLDYIPKPPLHRFSPSSDLQQLMQVKIVKKKKRCCKIYVRTTTVPVCAVKACCKTNLGMARKKWVFGILNNDSALLPIRARCLSPFFHCCMLRI